MKQRGRQIRIAPATEAAIKKARSRLVKESFAHAVHALVHEALKIEAPPTPRELKTSGGKRGGVKTAQRKEVTPRSIPRGETP